MSVQKDELLIVAQYPPAEIRLQQGHLVAVYRKPIPQPGRGDQWVEVRSLDWGERIRAVPGEQIPEAFGFSITGAALGETYLAVTGLVIELNGEMTDVICLYSWRQKSEPRVMKTAPVRCGEIAFDPSGYLWCLGTDTVAKKQGESYPLLYRYSTLGVLVARGVPRNSISSTTSPESYGSRGAPRIFILKSGAPLVLFPAADTVLQVGSNAQETKRWNPAVPSPKAMYTSASTGERIISLLPPDPATGYSDERYRLHEFSEPQDKDSAGQARWVVLPGLASKSFARYSNELIGMDGMRPVIWNRSAGSLNWLPPIE